MHVVVIGGGVAGLSAGLGLAREGHQVTILERDPAPGDGGVEEAFASWRRKGVPQIRQGHFVLGRAKAMLEANAPDVLDALANEGIVGAYSPMLALLPADQLQPGDDLAPIPTRRIPFELTMRRVAEATDGITIRGDAQVTGLASENGIGRPRVRGVRLADGTDVPADFVVDAAGRRSGVQEWLRTAGATLPPEQTQDAGVTYFGRYFRARGDTPDPWALLSSSSDAGYASLVVFPGDRGTYGVVFFAPSWDKDFRALRNDEAWMRAAREFPPAAPWIASDYAEALTSVDVTAGHANTLRPFLDDGVPTYLGSLPVGDAVCTTDAPLAWGLSLGMTTGFAAARAISEYASDPGDAALAYGSEVWPELEECYRVASTGSRVRIRKWRGTYEGPTDADEEREALFAVLTKSLDKLFADPALLRGFMRRINLVDPPNTVFSDAEFVSKLRAISEQSRSRGPAQVGPTRDELVRLLGRETASAVHS